MSPKKTEVPAYKHYVLDTNVLVHDPQALFHFEDNEVWLPIQVLEELDRFKSETSTRGANAREVHRKLSERFHTAEEMRKGVKLENGGRLRVCIQAGLPTGPKAHPFSDALRALFTDDSVTDNRILATAAYLADTLTAPTILVTKDLNLQLKARAIGLEAEDYRTDRVDDHDIRRTQRRNRRRSTRRWRFPAHRLQAFASEGHLSLPETRELLPNQYVLLQDAASGHGVPARHLRHGEFRALRRDHIAIRGGRTFTAMNLGQRFLLDALYDPEITLVTVYGKAGTGKTLLSVGPRSRRCRRASTRKCSSRA